MPTVTAASATSIDRGQLAARIPGARKADSATVGAAIAELAAARTVTDDRPVTLTKTGQAGHQTIRSSLEEIIAQLSDFPAEDIATARRVLAIITARPTRVLAGQPMPTALA